MECLSDSYRVFLSARTISSVYQTLMEDFLCVKHRKSGEYKMSVALDELKKLSFCSV